MTDIHDNFDNILGVTLITGFISNEDESNQMSRIICLLSDAGFESITLKNGETWIIFLKKHFYGHTQNQLKHLRSFF